MHNSISMDYFSIFKRIALIFCLLALTSCSKSTYKGAFVGGLIGAGTGAIIDSQAGNTGIATAVGAGTGALVGGVIGNSFQKQEGEQDNLAEQQRYQKAELSRQEREIEDIKRQQRYDDLYRRYQAN